MKFCGFWPASAIQEKPFVPEFVAGISARIAARWNMYEMCRYDRAATCACPAPAMQPQVPTSDRDGNVHMGMSVLLYCVYTCTHEKTNTHTHMQAFPLDVLSM